GAPRPGGGGGRAGGPGGGGPRARRLRLPGGRRGAGAGPLPRGDPWGSTHQLQLPLGGAHQALNGAVAAAAVLTLAARRGDPEGGQPVAWEREAVRWLEEGWRGLRWPGRFEIVPGRLILDGAHNPEGARALAQALAPCFGPGAGEGERPSLYLVFSCMEDKP